MPTIPPHDGKVDVEPSIRRVDSLTDSIELSPSQYWESSDSSKSVTILAALIKADLQRRFDLGKRPKVAEYLEKYPLLAQSNDRVVSLVYEEFCLLQDCGEDPDSEEFCQAYAPWRDSLLSQLAYHRELSLAVGSSSPRIKFPSVGDQFERYKLRSLLGVGGVARVYLATEDDLGGRKLAIKVSASFGQEPTILAKLDHHNIVPILTVARSESGLRGICMPYRPGITLEGLIERIGRGSPPRHARDLWNCLEPRDDDSLSTPDDQRVGWTGFPIKGKLPEAVGWIGLALANALTYLHGQGVYHRDIKPANVLLAYKEGPQLLDFNLAQDPKAPDQVNAALKGGTLPYMAPEQLRAFLDPSAWDSVGATADLYSLGLILREILTGRPPEVPTSKSSLTLGIQALLDRRAEPRVSTREFNPNIPPALDSIIAKCLEFDPEDRYRSAAELAKDLHRLLARKPLAFASNSSKIERVANWISRNSLLAAAIPAVIGVALLYSTTQSPDRVLDGPRFPEPTRAPATSQIRDEPEFIKAVANLNSGLPHHRKVAEFAFEQLSIKFPKSAFPALYLVVTREKLGKQSSDEADSYVRNSCTQADADEAIKELSSKNPESPTVLAAQGYRLSITKKYAAARALLEKALELNPDRIPRLLEMILVEKELGRLEKSTEYIFRAIQAETRAKRQWLDIFDLRQAALPNLARLADQVIDRGSPESRKLVVPKLDGLEENLGELDKLRGTMPIDGNREFLDRLNKPFYGGVLASCRAVLAADDNDLSVASRLFDEAREKFEGTLDILKESATRLEGLETQIEIQKKKLEIRQAKYLPSTPDHTQLQVGAK